MFVRLRDPERFEREPEREKTVFVRILTLPERLKRVHERERMFPVAVARYELVVLRRLESDETVVLVVLRFPERELIVAVLVAILEVLFATVHERDVRVFSVLVVLQERDVIAPSVSRRRPERELVILSEPASLPEKTTRKRIHYS